MSPVKLHDTRYNNTIFFKNQFYLYLPIMNNGELKSNNITNDNILRRKHETLQADLTKCTGPVH